jgi:hypothetical protein
VCHHAADVLLAPALGVSVARSGVDEVDAEVEASLDDGNGNVEVVGLFDSGLRAEGEEADLVAGLSKIARGHRARRSRIGGHGRKLALRGLGFLGEEAGGESASGLEEMTAVHGPPRASTSKWWSCHATLSIDRAVMEGATYPWVGEGLDGGGRAHHERRGA